MQKHTHTDIYTEYSLVYFYMNVTIALGDLGQGEIPLSLPKYIAVLNEKIRCVGTVKEQFQNSQQFQNCNIRFMRVFLMLQAGGEGMKGREIHIFSA